MATRREFLSHTAMGIVALAVGPVISQALAAEAASGAEGAAQAGERWRIPHRLGLGGVAIGNGFNLETSDEAAQATLQAAWEGGVRYFDTSPWYGLGLSERRFGHFLHSKQRGDYVLSTKIGRLLSATKDMPETQWKNPSPFAYRYDYSASGTRRSIEDSLQRLGIDSIDIVFIHDISSDNKDMGGRWTEYFDEAAKGAMPELTRMREEGIIKGWGMGVNTIDPILRALKEADPDVFLAAAQYSLLDHRDSLARLFPACEAKHVSLVIGSPLNAGFLAGRDRYNYAGAIPDGFKEKRARMEEIAQKHGADLRTAAIQFCMAPKVVASVIPGARSPEQVTQNIASAKAQIPADFWAELKKEKFLPENAPIPAA